MRDETKAYRILLQMFETIEKTIRRPPRDCFNLLVRYLADCARIHPIPETEHHVADRLWPLTKPFLKAFYEEPRDYLGTVFAEKECGNEDLGQLITPREIVRFMNQMAIAETIRERQEGEAEKPPLTMLDPCTGTGRFLVEAALQYPSAELAFFGVELDIDLYRAALVNMRLIAWHRPYWILCANTLIVGVGAGSPNWRFANQWDPPDWRTEMVMEEGGTWAEWCKQEGHDIEEAPTPQRSDDADDPTRQWRDDDEEDPLQPKLL